MRQALEERTHLGPDMKAGGGDRDRRNAGRRDGDRGGSPSTLGVPVLLVWDAPNLDMDSSSRSSAGAPPRHWAPRFDALGRCRSRRPLNWPRRIPTGAGAGGQAKDNIAPGSAEVVRPWVEALRTGFAVFAKPKVDDDSDVDADMLAHIARRHDEGLAALLVASADGQAFRTPLRTSPDRAYRSACWDFHEHASWALASDSLEFVTIWRTFRMFSESRCRSHHSLPSRRRRARSVRCPRC